MSRQSFWLAAWRFNRTIPLILLGLLVGNVALFLLLTLVVYPRTDSAERTLVDLQRSARSQKRAVTPEQAFAQGEQDLAEFRAHLPDVRRFADLIGDLYELSGRCHLKIGQIAYTPKELPEEQILSYGMTFIVAGTYGDLKRFIHGLETSPRIMVIEQVALNAAGQDEYSGQVSLNVKITTYFRREANDGS